jgi:CheY-like chemotaxis protein
METQQSQPILLVDDDSDLRESLALLLVLKGYEVITASDGREALQTLHGGPRPCLIVLDLMMPEMDGFQFRRAQLEDPALAMIPVVLCSGHPTAPHVAEQLGALACFEKPFDVQLLLSVVASQARSAAGQST